MSFLKFPLLDPIGDPLLHKPLLALVFFKLWLSCWSRNAADEYDVRAFPPVGDEPITDLDERC
jgi:hypothetical protein